MEQERSPAPVDRLISDLMAVQHGVVGRRQLQALGVRPGAIAHRMRVGRLHPLHRGVYAVGHRPMTAEGRWMAAVLACGDGALLSHRPAASLWDLLRGDGAALEVTVPVRSRGRRRPGITVHRPRALSPEDASRRHGVPVTSPARTLFDLAEVVPGPALERAVERAEVLRIFDLGSVQRVLHENSRRRGSAALRRILEHHRADPALTRSELEDLFLALCAAHGIPRPRVNVGIGPYEVDFLWPAERLVVETDGRAHHATRAAFESDRARDAQLTAAGYRVLRFTYRQVTREPEQVAALIRSALEGGG